MPVRSIFVDKVATTVMALKERELLPTEKDEDFES